MSYKIVDLRVPESKYSIKCPYKMTPTSITVHNTANDASARSEVEYMRSNGNQVSFHVAIDDREAVQAIAFNRNAWHAGDGMGPGNTSSISIEICYSKSGGTRFDEAEKNAAAYVAGVLEQYGWGVDKVTTHQHWSGKYCPHRTLDRGWNRFLKMVEEEMKPKKAEKVKAGWKQYGSKYKYVFSDGSYKKNGWLILEDGSYLFDEDGWMLTGFQTTENGNSFYLDPKTGRCLEDCELTIKIDDGGRITLK